MAPKSKNKIPSQMQKDFDKIKTLYEKYLQTPSDELYIELKDLMTNFTTPDDQDTKPMIGTKLQVTRDHHIPLMETVMEEFEAKAENQDKIKELEENLAKAKAEVEKVEEALRKTENQAKTTIEQLGDKFIASEKEGAENLLEIKKLKEELAMAEEKFAKAESERIEAERLLSTEKNSGQYSKKVIESLQRTIKGLEAQVKTLLAEAEAKAKAEAEAEAKAKAVRTDKIDANTKANVEARNAKAEAEAASAASKAAHDKLKAERAESNALQLKLAHAENLQKIDKTIIAGQSKKIEDQSKTIEELMKEIEDSKKPKPKATPKGAKRKRVETKKSGATGSWTSALSIPIPLLNAVKVHLGNMVDFIQHRDTVAKAAGESLTLPQFLRDQMSPKDAKKKGCDEAVRHHQMDKAIEIFKRWCNATMHPDKTDKNGERVYLPHEPNMLRAFFQWERIQLLSGGDSDDVERMARLHDAYLSTKDPKTDQELTNLKTSMTAKMKRVSQVFSRYLGNEAFMKTPSAAEATVIATPQKMEQTPTLFHGAQAAFDELNDLYNTSGAVLAHTSKVGPVRTATHVYPTFESADGSTMEKVQQEYASAIERTRDLFEQLKKKLKKGHDERMSDPNFATLCVQHVMECIGIRSDQEEELLGDAVKIFINESDEGECTLYPDTDDAKRRAFRNLRDHLEREGVILAALVPTTIGKQCGWVPTTNKTTDPAAQCLGFFIQYVVDMAITKNTEIDSAIVESSKVALYNDAIKLFNYTFGPEVAIYKAMANDEFGFKAPDDEANISPLLLAALQGQIEELFCEHSTCSKKSQEDEATECAQAVEHLMRLCSTLAKVQGDTVSYQESGHTWMAAATNLTKKGAKDNTLSIEAIKALAEELQSVPMPRIVLGQEPTDDCFRSLYHKTHGDEQLKRIRILQVTLTAFIPNIPDTMRDTVLSTIGVENQNELGCMEDQKIWALCQDAVCGCADVGSKEIPHRVNARSDHENVESYHRVMRNAASNACTVVKPVIGNMLWLQMLPLCESGTIDTYETWTKSQCRYSAQQKGDRPDGAKGDGAPKYVATPVLYQFIKHVESGVIRFLSGPHSAHPAPAVLSECEEATKVKVGLVVAGDSASRDAYTHVLGVIDKHMEQIHKDGSSPPDLLAALNKVDGEDTTNRPSILHMSWVGLFAYIWNFLLKETEHAKKAPDDTSAESKHDAIHRLYSEKYKVNQSLMFNVLLQWIADNQKAWPLSIGNNPSETATYCMEFTRPCALQKADEFKRQHIRNKSVISPEKPSGSISVVGGPVFLPAFGDYAGMQNAWVDVSDNEDPDGAGSSKPSEPMKMITNYPHNKGKKRKADDADLDADLDTDSGAIVMDIDSDGTDFNADDQYPDRDGRDALSLNHGGWLPASPMIPGKKHKTGSDEEDSDGAGPSN